MPAGTSRTGLATTPVETMRQRAQIAIDTGYQLCIHAIGDRANREVLNIYEEAFKKNNKNGKDLRWRIEHAQHINAADIPRFGQLGVIAAMQGIHCTSDAPWVEPRLGAKRAEEGAYVWQKLMKSGAVVTNGTDAPVEDVDPIASYYATVTRKAEDGKVFYGDQKMSRIEALQSYTLSERVRGVRRGPQGLAVARQARRHHGADEGHHDRARRGDSSPRRWRTRSSAGKSSTRARRRLR